MDCWLQAADMQKYYGRERGVVVSHPHSKWKSKREREREGEGMARGERGERERREGTPAGRKIAERGFDLRTFGL